MKFFVLLTFFAIKYARASLQASQTNQIILSNKTTQGDDSEKKVEWLNFESISTKGSQQDGALAHEKKLWTNGVIPFAVAFHKNVRDEEKNTAQIHLDQAILEWETNTCIRFVHRQNEKDYVVFYFSSGKSCESDVGRKGGKQIVYLGKGCLQTSAITHEIGHIVGFLHEHSRSDRDDYVTIATENVNNEKINAFKKFPNYNIHSLGLEYDYFSIMHYPMNAFSINQKNTILPKANNINKLGNDRLSNLDIKKIKFLYKCDALSENFHVGVWSLWSRWKPCTESCGGGTRERTRICRRMQNRTNGCLGPEIETEACNNEECPDWPRYPNDFSFAGSRDVDNLLDCVLIYEREDLNDLRFYSFCQRSERKIGMRWSDNGPINEMKCTLINEPLSGKSWNDNYLCLPKFSPFNFTWSFEGPLKNLSCIQWYSKEGKDGWDNNYLCANEFSRNRQFQSPVNGKYSSWSEWSKCTKECGTGNQHRFRFCDNPAPKFEGEPCRGNSLENKKCNIQKCPQPCHKVFTVNKGVFYSPNYPNFYPSDLNCSWLIKGGTNQRVKLLIEKLDFERFLMEPCLFDYLIVRDGDMNGKEIGKYCGQNALVTVVSATPSLWINMVTDSQENRTGFNASWELIDRKACGEVYTSITGELSTPHYPSLYSSNMKCDWEIVVDKDSLILLRFIAFETEKNGSCEHDYLEITDGDDSNSILLSRICGLDPLKDGLYSRTNKITLKFVSNEAIEKKGFKLKWRAVKKISQK